jgi:multicomponent Na+:H+ antiporter subunit F
MNELFLISALLISIFILLMIFRIAFSQNVPERIVALDTINTLIITLMIVLGAMSRKALYIDIGIVYGIISFIGTLFISRYLIQEKK